MCLSSGAEVPVKVKAHIFPKYIAQYKHTLQNINTNLYAYVCVYVWAHLQRIMRYKDLYVYVYVYMYMDRRTCGTCRRNCSTCSIAAPADASAAPAALQYLQHLQHIYRRNYSTCSSVSLSLCLAVSLSLALSHTHTNSTAPAAHSAQGSPTAPFPCLPGNICTFVRVNQVN
jgi:hypothetical protein